MPRRRPVRKEVSKRPAHAIPEANHGRDMNREQRREKVQTMIRDFKIEVDSRIRGLKADLNQSLNQIDLAYTLELMSLPVKVRQMPLKDFLNNGSFLETNDIFKDLDEKLNVILEGDSLSSRKNIPLKNIDESNSDESKIVQPTRRRKKSVVAGEGLTPISKRNRKAFETPVYEMCSSAAIPPVTPVTPKFDPRLYQTPAVMTHLCNPGKSITQSTKIVPLSGDKVFVCDGDIEADKIDTSQVHRNFFSLFQHNLIVMDARLKAISNYKSDASK